MPRFNMTQDGWYDLSFTIEDNDREKEVLYLEHDNTREDDRFIVRRVHRDGKVSSRIAVIEDNSGTLFSYDVMVDRECVATLTKLASCCSESYELEVYGGKHKKRTFFLDSVSFFRTEYAITRHGRELASYSTSWWSGGRIDIDDRSVRGDPELQYLLIYACAILARIHQRRSQMNQNHQSSTTANATEAVFAATVS